MSALITNTPVLVPLPATYPTLYSTVLSTFGSANFNGPFASGGKLYLVLNAQGLGGIAIYASSNSGATWAIQDTANQPAAASAGITIAQVGSVLHIAFVVAGDVFVQTFDCSTNLWGTVSTNAGLATVQGLAIVVQADGRRFVYCSHTGTANVINLMILSAGGVWSGPTAMLTAAAGRRIGLLGVVLDSGGTSNVFFFTTSGALLNTILSYIPVSSVPVVGAAVAISANFPTPAIDGTGTVAFNSSLGANGTYGIPLPFQVGVAGGKTTPLLVLGDPVGGWSTVSPDSGGSTVPAGSSTAVVECLASGSTIIAFWNVYNDATGLVDTIWLGIWNGTAWNTPQLLYDAVANPPPVADAAGPSQGPLNTQQPSIAILPNGTYGVSFSLLVSANPPANHGFAFPNFFAASVAAPVAAPVQTQSGGGPPKYTPARPAGVVDLHPNKSKCAECKCEDVVNLVLQYPDMFLMD